MASVPGCRACSAAAGCGDSNITVEPLPPAVADATRSMQDVTSCLEFTGATAAVNMVMRLAVLSMVLAVMMSGADSNVHTQIGITFFTGLACKNATRVVEFALAECEGSKSVLDAAVDVARLRFRSIWMTSVAYFVAPAFTPVFYLAMKNLGEKRESPTKALIRGRIINWILSVLLPDF